MMTLVYFLIFRAVATTVAANCCGAGVSGSPCRTIFGGTLAGFCSGFSYVVCLYFHTDFLFFP